MNRLLVILAGTALLVACGREQERSVPPMDNATQTSSAARRALDEYVINFWVKRDTLALGRALSPTMIYHYNGVAGTGTPDVHQKALQSFGGAFPDLVATVDTFVYDGDMGAAATTWTGSFSGSLCGVTGTGNKVSWVVNYVFRVADGKIVEMWEAWDEGGTYSKLGLDVSRCPA